MDVLTLFFLRHGECEANVARRFAGRTGDSPLTEKGVLQAQRAADGLRAIPFGRVLSSPLARARRTAEIANQYHGLALEQDESLSEVNFGILDGESYDSLTNLQVFEAVLAQWQAGDAAGRVPQGESLAEVVARFERFLAGLGDCDSKPVLVVGHSIYLMAAIWGVMADLGPEIGQYRQRQGHVSILRAQGGRLALAAFDVDPGEPGDALKWSG